jgi:hypothetical protein
MLKIRHAIIALGMLLSPAAPADDVRVGIGIGLPYASIGINIGGYPRLVGVPGYPVYYAPYVQANFFFYDGMYWVFEGDHWYASYWYNGPWWFVGPEVVPVYLLRIPVRYYRRPPPYFHGWHRDRPPRWGTHWGREWEQHRHGWDRSGDYRTAPPRAPLPSYQRGYSGERYPGQVERQREIREQHYRYQPRDPVVRQHDQERGRKAPPPQQGPRPGGKEQGRGRDD